MHYPLSDDIIFKLRAEVPLVMATSFNAAKSTSAVRSQDPGLTSGSQA